MQESQKPWVFWASNMPIQLIQLLQPDMNDYIIKLPLVLSSLQALLTRCIDCVFVFIHDFFFFFYMFCSGVSEWLTEAHRSPLPKAHLPIQPGPVITLGRPLDRGTDQLILDWIIVLSFFNTTRFTSPIAHLPTGESHGTPLGESTIELNTWKKTLHVFHHSVLESVICFADICWAINIRANLIKYYWIQ